MRSPQFQHDDRRRRAVTRAAEYARDELLRVHRRRAARVTPVTSRNGEARVKKKYGYFKFPSAEPRVALPVYYSDLTAVD